MTQGIACARAGCLGVLWPMAGATETPTFWVRVRPGKGWWCSAVAPLEGEEKAGQRAWRCPDCLSIYRAVEGGRLGYVET
jgi:hypothetical protein